MTGDVAALVRLSAVLAAGDGARLDEAMDRAAEAADPVTAEEALVQSYLFLGYPAALNAMQRWRGRTGRVAPAPVPDDWQAWGERGEEVCSRVYAGQYERLREHVASLHPDLERWMLLEGYGKVLGRPGLPLHVRELCIVALLAGLDAAPQLRAHLRGALNVGADPADVTEALEIGCAASPARAEQARGVWEEVRARWLGRRRP